jgi:hypothetical protein
VQYGIWFKTGLSISWEACNKRCGWIPCVARRWLYSSLVKTFCHW